MAADIEQHTGIRPTLIKGRNGIFDIKLDGQLVFSKHAMKRFPEHREVLAKLPERA